jgi:hypothetical protein
MKPLFSIASIIAVASMMAFVQGNKPARKVHIFMLAGQSNMAGRGTPEAIDTTINPHIWMLNKAEEWVPAREPLHFDKPKVVGTGPGFAFARAVYEKDPSADIYLVPCAVGGTRIDLWKPGAYDSATKTHPYDDAMRRIRKALPAGELKAIIWHQGESDCNPKLSDTYQQKLAELVQRFRTELNMPTLPFIMGEIAHFRTEPNPDKVIVNKAIKTVAATVPHCGFVETGGMQHRGDTLHFDSPSAREIGKRYAAVYGSMKKPS